MKKRSAGRSLFGVILLILFVGVVGYLGFFANTQTKPSSAPAQTFAPGNTAFAPETVRPDIPAPETAVSEAPVSEPGDPEAAVSETVKTESGTSETPKPETGKAETGTSETPEPSSSPESPKPSSAPESPEPSSAPDTPASRAAALGLPEPPDIDINSWEFLLANIDNNIAEYVPPEIVNIEGQYFDSRIVDAMNAFVADTRAQGLSVYLSSGYRSYSDQAANFQRVVNNGYVDGKTWDGFYVSMPAGTSEHQTGLVCDITDIYYPLKDKLIENTETYKYMSAHCQEYGFIVRYPDGKQDITGVMYEPWHFRYVGVEAATYIMENGLCLEEFLDLYR